VGTENGWEVAATYAGVAGLALWAWRQCARAHVGLLALLGSPPGRDDWRHLAVVPALMALSVAGFFLLWYPLSYVMPRVVQSWALEYDSPSWIRGAPLRSAFDVLLIVVIGPVVEEVVFRGVLLQRFAHKWGARTAIAVSSLLFGLGHADVVGAGLFGVVMAVLYVRTGALWIPIACHVLSNALAVVAEISGRFSALPASAPDYTIAQFRADWWMGVTALALAIGLLYVARRWLVLPRGWVLPGRILVKHVN
jgi:membrane protease YdiL (CAAX protease family)